MPGGKLLPPLFDATKLNKLESEIERLHKEVTEKEKRKRESLREWSRLERDSDNARMRSEAAERHLAVLSGEGEGAEGAF